MACSTIAIRIGSFCGIQANSSGVMQLAKIAIARIRRRRAPMASTSIPAGTWHSIDTMVPTVSTIPIRV